MKDIVKEQSENYQPLFDLMKDEHGLILLESEMDDIISKSDAVKFMFKECSENKQSK